MADIMNPVTTPNPPPPPQTEGQQEQPHEDVANVFDDDSDEESSEGGSQPPQDNGFNSVVDDLEDSNRGVQATMARLLAIMIKDQRDGKDHRTETRKPVDFKGTESAREVRNWLQSMDFYFENRKVFHDSERITTTLSYCVGKAAEFARRVENDRANLERDEKPALTWKRFKKDFTRTWVNIDIASAAREEIRNLRMDKDQRAEEFLIEFKNLASETGYDDLALIDRLKEALVPRLCQKVMELPKRDKEKVKKYMPGYRPEKLSQWYDIVQDFDSSYRESRMFQNENRTREGNRKEVKKDNTSSSPRPHNHSNFNRGSNNAQPRQNNGNGQNSGQSQARRAHFQTRAAQGPDERICYRCDKPGHIARNCPTMPSGSQPRKPAFQARQASSSTSASQDMFAGLPDDTLDILSRALQSASSQRTAAHGDAKGKAPASGFRRSRK